MEEWCLPEIAVYLGYNNELWEQFGENFHIFSVGGREFNSGVVNQSWRSGKISMKVSVMHSNIYFTSRMVCNRNATNQLLGRCRGGQKIEFSVTTYILVRWGISNLSTLSTESTSNTLFRMVQRTKLKTFQVLLASSMMELRYEDESNFYLHRLIESLTPVNRWFW